VRVVNPATSARSRRARQRPGPFTRAASSTLLQRRRTSSGCLRGVAPVEITRITYDETEPGAGARARRASRRASSRPRRGRAGPGGLVADATTPAPRQPPSTSRRGAALSCLHRVLGAARRVPPARRRRQLPAPRRGRPGLARAAARRVQRAGGYRCRPVPTPAATRRRSPRSVCARR
jgi:hypothetical protein